MPRKDRTLTAGARLIYQYELHAILYHDGLYGLGHTYSYIRQHDGKWWKVSDGVAKEVRPLPLCGTASLRDIVQTT